jgi:hypothetical protein
MTRFILLVPAAAVLLIVAHASAAAILPLARARLAGRAREPALHAAAVLAPWVLGALAVAALLSPRSIHGCHCADHGLHHPHLCLLHPSLSLPLLAPSLLVLGAWGALAIPRLARVAREVVASTRWLRLARRGPRRVIDGVLVHLAPCGSSAALTVGVFSPIIVLDPRVFRALAPDARRAVVHHEVGHRLRADGLTLLVLRIAAASLALVDVAPLVAGWKTACEVTCDAHAATRVGDPTIVAEALLSACRLGGTTTARPPAYALGALEGGSVERRVLALVGDEASPAKTPHLGNDALAVALVSLGAAALTCVAPGDVLHHAVETLVGLAIR